MPRRPIPSRRRRRLGQHFLHDASFVERIVAALAPAPTDRVVEIGPGTGVLTRALAPRVARLVAVELDAELAEASRHAAEERPAVTVVHGDALTVALDALVGSAPARDERWRVVGNLPYSVATAILERWLARSDLFRDLLVMVQAEVADRIVAAPGGRPYGWLSVRCQLDAVPRRVMRVPPGAFRPPPRVDSAVVHLVLRDRPAVDVADRAAFLRFVGAAFAQRRKTVPNSLAGAGAGAVTRGRAACRAAGIDPKRRAETLDLAELARLYASWAALE